MGCRNFVISLKVNTDRFVATSCFFIFIQFIGKDLVEVKPKVK